MATKKQAAVAQEKVSEEKRPRSRRDNLPPGPGPGRPKGVPNKIRADVAELVRDALELLGDARYLVVRGKRNPNAFLGLVQKLMPTNIKAEVNVNSDLAARLSEAEQRIKNPKS